MSRNFDFKEFLTINEKYVVITALVICLFIFLYIFFFLKPLNRTEEVVYGKLLSANNSVAKSIFNNCVVELDEHKVVVATCRGSYFINSRVKVIKTTFEDHEVRYSIE